MHLNGSRFLLRICRALNLDRNQFVEVLSRICRRQKECLDGSRIYQESIDQTKSTKNCLNGSKKLSRMCRAWTQKSRWVKKLSRFYREKAQKSRWIQKLSRCYREGRECRKNPRWIEKLSRIYQERRKKSSIERNLSRSYRAWRKWVFQREKHKEINATSKLLNQRSKQHFKLSRHLSTYKHSINRSKHAHTD